MKPIKLFCVAAATLLVLLSDALAIVDANSSANTSNPGDGSPWDNIGALNGATGTYVGNGWVLTAGHVAGTGTGTVVFSVGSFAYDAHSIQLKNPDNTNADLVLLHLTTLPALPSLTLAATTPSALSSVDLEGYGYIRGSATTFSGTNGFTYGTMSKSWGTNRVDPGGIQTINPTGSPTWVFTTTFDDPAQPLSTANEAQVADGDSGGAAFYKDAANVWELAGIVSAKGIYNNQPNNTAIYGNASYLADVATYRSQIVAVVPEPDVCWLLVVAGGVFVCRRRCSFRSVKMPCRSAASD